MAESAGSQSERPFAFSHALIRQVLYESMPSALRQSLHGRVGAARESHVEARRETVFEVAHHYVVAHQKGKAADVMVLVGESWIALRPVDPILLRCSLCL